MMLASLRRAVLSFCMAGPSALTLWFALVALSLIPGFDGAYANVAQHLSFLPDDAKKLPWGAWTVLGVVLAGTGIIWATPAPKAIEFLLFAEFDDETLDPVPPQTGMFVWHLPEGSKQRAAWDALKTWVGVSGKQARWSPAWIWGRPRRADSFRWTIVLGGNGMGKSQLARELGRHLARRTPSEGGTHDSANRDSAPARLHRWWCRVACWRTADDVPWDAGLIGRSEDRQKLLAAWLPRAPTLLILDDPPAGGCDAVISALARNQSKFWYPVRLVIVAQFVPPDLPIVKNSRRPGWHHRDSTEEAYAPVELPAVEFDAKRFRATLAGGLWVSREDARGVKKIVLETGASIPSLVRDVDFERLVGAVDGSPLLLGLAAHWLQRPGATLDDLLRLPTKLIDDEAELFCEEKYSHDSTPAHLAAVDLRRTVAHRLVSERVQHLYDSLRRLELPSPAAVCKAVACATIAGGISRAAALKEFGVKLEPATLHRLFPGFSDSKDQIPPLLPWILGESFVLDVEREVLSSEITDDGRRDQVLDSLIRDAWRINPDGTLHCLSRPGRLAARVTEYRRQASAQFAGEEQLKLFLAVAHRSSFVAQDVLDASLSMAGALDATLLDAAVAGIDRMLAARRPNPLAACSLHCTLTARTLDTAPVTFDGLARMLGGLRTMLVRVGATNDERLLRSFRALATSLLQGLTLWDEEDAFEGFLLLHQELARWLGQDLLNVLSNVGGGLARARPRPSRVLKVFAGLWAIMNTRNPSTEGSTRETLASAEGLTVTEERRGHVLVSLLRYRIHAFPSNAPVSDVDAALLDVDEIGGRFPDDPRIQAQRIGAWRWALSTDGVISGERASSMDHVMRLIEEIAANFPGDVDVQRERMTAWAEVARTWSKLEELLPHMVIATRRIDELASPFPHDRNIQWVRAQAWLSFSNAHQDSQKARPIAEEAARRIEEIVAPFGEDPDMQSILALALCVLGTVQCKERNSLWPMTDMARRVDEVALPFNDHVSHQFARATTWCSVAEAGSRSVDGDALVVAAARRVDEITARYSTAVAFQRARAKAWSRVALVHSAQRSTFTDAAACRVDAIARAFGSDREIQFARAMAWSSAVTAAAEMPEANGPTERAVRRVDEIAGHFPDDVDIVRLRALAWRTVALVRSSSIEHRSGTESAAAELDLMAESHPADPIIQHARAAAWASVASAWSKDSSTMALTESAARRVDSVAGLSGDDELQSLRVGAWRHVAFARSELADQRHLAQNAARIVDEIADHWPRNVSMQAERARAWWSVVSSWDTLGETALADAAARQCIEHVERLADAGSEFATLRLSLLARLREAQQPS
jgi:hypothetical protein